MATTTNYGWTTPDDSQAFKLGANAIRTLGSSIDTTLGTALGGTYPGLRLVKKQTIGTAVSSVTVTSAFSSTYENYKILITGGVGSTSSTYLQLALDSINTGYFSSLVYASFTSGVVAGAAGNNTASFPYVGFANTTSINASVELTAAGITEQTRMSAPFLDTANTGTHTGVCSSTNAHTSFTISCSSGTLTGGTIYVYGYGTS
jgi:hypothetical protein